MLHPTLSPTRAFSGIANRNRGYGFRAHRGACHRAALRRRALQLPKAEHDAEDAEHDGPTMFAWIEMMRALNRYVERVFDTSRQGYFGRHYVLILPSDVKDDSIDKKHVPDLFELQI